MIVCRRQRDQQCRGRLGEQVVEAGRVGDQHLGDAGKLGGGLGGGIKAATGDQRVHVTQFLRRGDRAAGRLLDAGGVEFQQDQSRHRQITFASVFNFATSSLTDPTFTPALRFGGSDTLIRVNRGAGSTPRSAGFMLTIGFLRAFMMLGSEA